MKEITVAAGDGGIRLDRWFKRHLPNVTHGLLEKSLRRGMVRLDGKKAKSSDRLEEGQLLRFPEEWSSEEPQERKKKGWEPSEEDIALIRSLVIYDNPHLVVINKPAGLPVQGGSGLKRHIDGMLPGLASKKGEVPRLVHRLDKDTSGVLVLARSANDAAMLAKKFASKDVEKKYVALVKGVPEIRQGRITLPLAKVAKGKNSKTEAYEAVSVEEHGGQHAETLYRVLDTLGNQLSWVELFPVTGRTHQLRVHMAHIGHPIIGDGKYGGSEAFVEGGMDLPRQLHLHARSIRIPDVAGQTIEVSAPLPPHIQQSILQLGIEE